MLPLHVAALGMSSGAAAQLSLIQLRSERRSLRKQLVEQAKAAL